MHSSKHVYNFRADLPDKRDFRFKATEQVSALPTQVNLLHQQCPVVDQGQIGSCTANALAGFLGFIELQKKPVSFWPYSRLFIYYNERMLEGDVSQDAGATLRDGLKSIYSWGAPPETSWPYDPNFLFNKPGIGAYNQAATHKISWFARIQGLQQMKECLAGGHPFVYGFTVYESFESDEVAATGLVPMPDPSEGVLGGHAVLAVGYDDKTQTVLTKNSWGVAWGQEGYFQMPYAYLEDPDLTSDVWTIKR